VVTQALTDSAAQQPSSGGGDHVLARGRYEHAAEGGAERATQTRDQHCANRIRKLKSRHALRLQKIFTPTIVPHPANGPQPQSR
jgi:hypothetical protein